MQLAEILSDLVSLRVCVRTGYPSSPQAPHCSTLCRFFKYLGLTKSQDPAAALALVSVRPNSVSSTSNPQETSPQVEEQDPDIKRAKDLVELHYAVKEEHTRSELVVEMTEARRSVERVIGL